MLRMEGPDGQEIFFDISTKDLEEMKRRYMCNKTKPKPVKKLSLFKKLMEKIRSDQCLNVS